MSTHVEAEVVEQADHRRVLEWIVAQYDGVGWNLYPFDQGRQENAEAEFKYWDNRSHPCKLIRLSDLAARAAEEREKQAFLEKALEVCRRVVKQNTAVIAGPDTFGKAKAALAYFDSSVRAEGKEAGDE